MTSPSVKHAAQQQPQPQEVSPLGGLEVRDFEENTLLILAASKGNVEAAVKKPVGGRYDLFRRHVKSSRRIRILRRIAPGGEIGRGDAMSRVGALHDKGARRGGIG